MQFSSPFKFRLIYVFRINDATHRGCLKVGETTFSGSASPMELHPNSSLLNKEARERIDQYTTTAGIAYDLLHTELTLTIENGQLRSFNDGEVHKVLRRSGVRQKFFDTGKRANEWFVTDLETVKRAIRAAREGRHSLAPHEVSTGQSPIAFRPEQREAIDLAKKKFKKSQQFLWNAKMRFGKTLSALQLVKEMQMERTLILTHRPVVDQGWFEDFQKIFYDSPAYQYGSKSKGEDFFQLERLHAARGLSYVYFASMQDLRGSELVGGKFGKNEELFSVPWDMVIVDEAHEGTKTDLGINVMDKLVKEHTRVLRLSGTPFNLLDDFKEDEIYTWDYVMEQRAKQQWAVEHPLDPNPYAGLPKLNIYTYDMKLALKQYHNDDEAFNFKEFFRTDEQGAFVHDRDIDHFLNLLVAPGSRYPFARKDWQDYFRHSLWTLPGVREARALSDKLQRHPVFGQFEIVNVAGDGDEDSGYESNNALDSVERAIGPNPDLTRSITLSCGRLTTGVTVKAWTAVFMLSGSHSTSASSYMQTIFRVQSPATINGRVKEECFVFDFAPDRTLKVLAETAKVSARAGHSGERDKVILGEFLNFCPVISFHGSDMSPLNVDHMMQQLKRVYVERVVQNGFEDNYLYNDNLISLDKGELQEFDDLKKIIGATKAMPKSKDVDINNQGFTNEQYEEIERIKKKEREKRPLTEEEKRRLEELKEKRKNRDAAISILRGISIRMPMMLYGADIQNEEEELTLDNFTSLVDAQSWEEFMPKGVSKQRFNAFKKYYDPDIFAAAGKRIRQLARAADSMETEERIERITSIFATFRNPDKETVLTPWRVVNMHLGDTLGGYCFFGPDYGDTPLPQPRLVDHGEVTREVFSADSRVLEINSKSGLYPLYVAYSLHRLTGKPWDRVLEENLFIVCKTPMAKSITRRTLCGFRDTKVNVRYFEDLINQITNKKEQFITKVTDGQGYWKSNNDKHMKFTAVVGNPPYQEEGVSSRKSPVYHHFYEIAFLLSNKVTLITPGRFLFGAGQTPKEWSEKMLNDPHLSVVKYFPNSKDLFSNVDIKGGIVIMYRDAQSNFGKIGFFSMYERLTSVFYKVADKTDLKFSNLSLIVSSQGIYRFTDDLFSYVPRAYDVQGQGTATKITSKSLENLTEVFVEQKPKAGDYIQFLGLSKGKRVMKWIEAKYVVKPDSLNTHRVLVAEANGTGAIGEPLSTPIVLPPNIGHTDTFLTIGGFREKVYADNCLKYIKTKFSRALLATLKATQHNPKDTWANIPMQNFTETSDIDWSQPIADIDRQLYRKYHLTNEEIQFIESMIKPME